MLTIAVFCLLLGNGAAIWWTIQRRYQPNVDLAPRPAPFAWWTLIVEDLLWFGVLTVAIASGWFGIEGVGLTMLISTVVLFATFLWMARRRAAQARP